MHTHVHRQLTDVQLVELAFFQNALCEAGSDQAQLAEH
jgi:hypothetical protein